MAAKLLLLAGFSLASAQFVPSHTIYVPNASPGGKLSMLVIAWANGECQTDGNYCKTF
ncbi:hypothetical protein BGZ57DRAFT_888945 [Hyaloscypha finlandica]|nr:hypothetical protein BGZ57DRAFT_888945 [Hyaloscypha finlandica]